jgi:hypothetical protein
MRVKVSLSWIQFSAENLLDKVHLIAFANRLYRSDIPYQLDGSEGVLAVQCGVGDGSGPDSIKNARIGPSGRSGVAGLLGPAFFHYTVNNSEKCSKPTTYSFPGGA